MNMAISTATKVVSTSVSSDSVASANPTPLNPTAKPSFHVKVTYCQKTYTHSYEAKESVSTLAGLEPTPPKGIDF